MEAWSAQAIHLSPEIQSQVLAVLLQVAKDKKKRVREAVVQALGAWSAQAISLSSETHSCVLVALLQLGGGNERDVWTEVIQVLSTMPVTYESLLTVLYAKSYIPLQKMLGRGLLLSSLSLDQLLKLYFADNASGLSGSYQRRDLWLQFIIARVINDETSIIFQEDQCYLYGARFPKPWAVTIPEQNRDELMLKLKNALVAQAKSLSLPSNPVTALLKPSPEIKKDTLIKVDMSHASASHSSNFMVTVNTGPVYSSFPTAPSSSYTTLSGIRSGMSSTLEEDDEIEDKKRTIRVSSEAVQTRTVLNARRTRLSSSTMSAQSSNGASLDIREAHVVGGSRGLLNASGPGTCLDARHLQSADADFSLVASKKPLPSAVPVQSPGPNSMFAQSSVAAKNSNKNNSANEEGGATNVGDKNKEESVSIPALGGSGS